jgi:hypothetical protein
MFTSYTTILSRERKKNNLQQETWNDLNLNEMQNIKVSVNGDDLCPCLNPGDHEMVQVELCLSLRPRSGPPPCGLYITGIWLPRQQAKTLKPERRGMTRERGGGTGGKFLEAPRVSPPPPTLLDRLGIWGALPAPALVLGSFLTLY